MLKLMNVVENECQKKKKQLRVYKASVIKLRCCGCEERRKGRQAGAMNLLLFGNQGTGEIRRSYSPNNLKKISTAEQYSNAIACSSLGKLPRPSAKPSSNLIRQTSTRLMLPRSRLVTRPRSIIVTGAFDITICFAPTLPCPCF